MMTELRELLDKKGVPWEGSDEHTVFDSGFETHVDRTTIDGVGSVIYSWIRDEDGRKRGDSRGYPAYLELQSGDDLRIVTPQEVADECSR